MGKTIISGPFEYMFTEEQYQNAVMRLADDLCGTSSHMAADAIIEYCGRPDIGHVEVERIVSTLSHMLKHT